eukprot:TRINITY_DN3320_c0_g1_i2.p1 TRINITY_DN3320_c0_g1~~TRINITY_DN3320_c0_g1_i2.p1  ORF type:complete len:103 (+),score=9.57 TRINITY_DN3320_c0_g1_i2:301-609(+)
MQAAKEVEFLVRLHGGDYCFLSSTYLSFSTDSIKIDDDAVSHVNRYIKKLDPQILSHYDVLVCVGTMQLYDFDFSLVGNGETKVLSLDMQDSPRTTSHVHPK